MTKRTHNYIFKNTYHFQGGAALIIVLILLTIASTVTIVIAKRATVDVRIAKNDQLAKQALFVAEAGLMETYQHLENHLANLYALNQSDPTLVDYYLAPITLDADLINGGTGDNADPDSGFANWGARVTFNGASYRQRTFNGENYYTRIIDNIDDASLTVDDDSKIWLETIGTVGDAQRTVRAFVITSSQTPGLFGIDELRITTDIVGYDSSLGAYHPVTNNDSDSKIGSNTLVTSNNSSTIDANVESPGTLNLSGDVTGEVVVDVDDRIYNVINHPDCEATPLSYYDNSAGGIIAIDPSTLAPNLDTIKYDGPAYPNKGNLESKGSSSNAALQLAAGVYCLNTLNSSANGVIITNGAVELYVSGDIDLAGSGIVNATGNPANLKIFSTGPIGTSIKFTGSSDAVMDLYAPNATVDIGGSASFSGRVIAKTVKVFNNNGIYVDTNLTRIRKFRLKSWQEIRN